MEVNHYFHGRSKFTSQVSFTSFVEGNYLKVNTDRKITWRTRFSCGCEVIMLVRRVLAMPFTVQGGYWLVGYFILQ